MTRDRSTPARLFTTFGTTVYVDPHTGDLCHGPIDTCPANTLLLSDEAGGSTSRHACLVTRHLNAESPVRCAPEEGCRAHAPGRPPGHSSALATTFEVVPLERGFFGLRSGGLFLCAERDGAITLSRNVCGAWECFLGSEAWCSEPNAQIEGGFRGEFVDSRGIRRLVIDPRLRMASGRTARAKRILIFANTEWSNGRVYYDVCKNLHRLGYVVDILNWRESYASDYIDALAMYYDFFLSGLDGINVLVSNYGLPLGRIIGISHGIYYDLPLLAETIGIGSIEQLAGYGVVSYSMVSESVICGVRRIPQVASLGVAYDEFYMEPPTELRTVGYASAMSHRTREGIEKKRGELAEACARAAELQFAPAGTHHDPTSFHDMPDYYRTVDSILMTSLVEAAGLPVLEAAAAGRLVIGTPVGHFPVRAYEGCGIVAPLSSKEFTEFTTSKLAFYKANPTAFRERCEQIQAAARQFDWANFIQEWVDLIEGRGP